MLRKSIAEKSSEDWIRFTFGYRLMEREKVTLLVKLNQLTWLLKTILQNTTEIEEKKISKHNIDD